MPCAGEPEPCATSECGVTVTTRGDEGEEDEAAPCTELLGMTLRGETVAALVGAEYVGAACCTLTGGADGAGLGVGATARGADTGGALGALA